MEVSAEAMLVGNAGDSSTRTYAQRRVQIVKIKRGRHEDPQGWPFRQGCVSRMRAEENSRHPKSQRRKLGKKTVMKFTSLGRIDIATRRKQRITKPRVRPRVNGFVGAVEDAGMSFRASGWQCTRHPSLEKRERRQIEDSLEESVGVNTKIHPNSAEGSLLL